MHSSQQFVRFGAIQMPPISPPPKPNELQLAGQHIENIFRQVHPEERIQAKASYNPDISPRPNITVFFCPTELPAKKLLNILKQFPSMIRPTGVLRQWVKRLLPWLSSNEPVSYTRMYDGKCVPEMKNGQPTDLKFYFNRQNYDVMLAGCLPSWKPEGFWSRPQLQSDLAGH